MNVVTTMPIRIDPFTRQAMSTAVNINPITAISMPLVIAPNATSVAGLATTMPGALQADEAQEHPDTNADTPLEVGRNGVHDRFAGFGQHQQGDDRALDEDYAHRRLPGHASDPIEGIGQRALRPMPLARANG